MSAPIVVRVAGPSDAGQIADVLNEITAEGGLTIFDRPFSVDDERRFLDGLHERARVHVAVEGDAVLGVQSLDRFSTWSDSIAHVATIGTWVRRGARGRGIGRSLAAETFEAARGLGYTKVLITVLATNTAALRFYEGLGFTRIGLAREHVRLGGQLLDEVFLERGLNGIVSE
jgi:ribosomal protein S18 acetylase RimI-like enzyme